MASPSSSPSPFPFPSILPQTHPLLFPPPPSPLHLRHSSLSDQLLPLSHTLLNPPPQPPSPTPNPTWVNPSRPRPKVLSLRRHRRPSLSYNPDLKHLSALTRQLQSLPDDDPSAFDSAFPDPISRESALLILNSLRPWNKAYCFFGWLKGYCLRGDAGFEMETMFYNVAMKALRFGKKFDVVEELAEEMVEKGIEMDNVTYSTVITTAKRCRRFDRAIYWFERMYKTGLMPDEVTYSAILDVYARLGKVEEVLNLYEKGRASGWTPDAVAFSVLGKMYGEAGDYDGIRYVLGEMKTLGVEPNVVVYNTLLEAMGKAGKPGLARSLFDEMLSAGLTPNEKTLTALIKIYGKARWSRDALDLWERMKSNNWPMDFILYNTLLSMCADLGLEEEAERLFADMKSSKRSIPDSWSYTAMINIYASAGKVEKAQAAFEEMLENQVELNVMSCTCLIQCFGKAKRIDEAVGVFKVLMERGIKPDDRLCGCLLYVAAVCEEGEIDKVLDCIKKANPKLVEFVKMLGDADVSYDIIKAEFREILNETEVQARRPFCNCLIDICRNQNFPAQRAQELFSLGSLYGLYPGLHTKVSREWSLNLKSLSIGAAHTAFEEWMKILADCLQRKDTLPQRFSVYTGTGSHRLSEGLSVVFASRLADSASPFELNEETNGHFVATREDLINWMQLRVSEASVTA